MCENSQDSDWTVVTPPYSPNSKNNENESNRKLDLEGYRFRCLGPASKRDHQFHKEGFLKSNPRMKDFDIDDSDVNVILFKKWFQFWTALETDDVILFNLCRKNFMFLDSQTQDKGNFLEENKSNGSTLANIRENICQFFNYIYIFLKSSYKYYDKLEKLETNLSKLQRNLKSLQLLFHRLSLAYLPDYKLLYCSSQGNKSLNPVFHLVHCHLDVRWYYLMILEQIKRLTKDNQCSSLTQCVSNENDFTMDDYVSIVMSELLWLGIVRFEKTEKINIPSTSSFICVCIKEFWLLLIHFLGLKEFWRHFSQVLCLVLEKKSPPDNFTSNCSKFHLTEYFECSNRGQFTLWMLANVVKLYEYDVEGVYIGSRNSIETDFGLYDSIVKEFLNSEPSEQDLRHYIPLMESILNAWSHRKSDSVILLWETFHKKLSSAFYVKGEKLDSIQCSSFDASGLLLQVKNRLSGNVEFDRNENSYSRFLKLLGRHLEQCKRNGISTQKLCGRIFIKFPPTKTDKLLELSELGLYHLSSLYLTLALVTDVDSTVKKLQSLLTVLPRDKLSPAKRRIVSKSLSACLLILTENGSDVTETAEIILKEVKDSLSEEDASNMPIFLDCFEAAISNDNPQTPVLIDNWIGKYLKICSHANADRLFLTLKQMVDKLRSEFAFSSAEHMQKLKENLITFVLPEVNNRVTQSAADLAASFTLLFSYFQSNRNELVSLYEFWSNCGDVKLASRFLCSVMSDEKNLSMILSNYHTNAVQCWIRCSMLSGSHQEAKILTEKILTIPSVKQLSENEEVFLEFSDDPLSEFIQLFGTRYNKLQDINEKSKLRSNFLSYFGKLEKWIQHELKNTEGTNNKKVFDDIYRYGGEIIRHCHNLAYMRSNPKSLLKILIDLLLLPTQIHKQEFILPSSIGLAVFNHLHLYIRGLICLGPKTDGYISRILREITTQYLPRLFSFCGGDVQKHPIFKSIVVDENSAEIITEMISAQFLVVKNNNPHPHAYNSMRILTSASKTAVGKKIFEMSITSILNLIMLSGDHHPAKEESLTFIKINSLSQQNRNSLARALKTDCEKHNHISFTTKFWFGLLHRLLRIIPQDIENFLPEIEVEIAKLEKKRGLERDSTLRSFLEDLKSRLKNRFSKSD